MGNDVKKVASASSSHEREKTKDVLLRVAIDAIESVGEAHVRLDDILRDANASVSSLYHHYGSMRGLLDEAQLARFDSQTRENIGRFRDGVLRVTTRDEFRRLVEVTIEDLFSRERSVNRSRIMNAFGSIFETPLYHDRVVELERENLQLMVEAMEHAKKMEFVPQSLHVVGFSIWAIGLTFSRVIPDILNEDDVIDGWIEVTTHAILHAFGFENQ